MNPVRTTAFAPSERIRSAGSGALAPDEAHQRAVDLRVAPACLGLDLGVGAAGGLQDQRAPRNCPQGLIASGLVRAAGS